MSFKSLLQLFFLLLIFIIIALIYFLYFYSGPLKNENILSKTFGNFKEVKNLDFDSTDQAILEDTNETEEINKNKDINEKKNLNSIVVENKKNSDDYVGQSSNKYKNSDNLKKNNEQEKIKNLTKEIEYITTNKDGDIFKILAKYGKTNIKNSNILDLEKVDGVITSEKRSEIFISSDFAKYNYNNQNSQFYGNVVLNYDDKTITCDNLDLQINKNYAIAYNNVKVMDNKSVMKAQVITLNLLTKDININSQEKIKIYTN